MPENSPKPAEMQKLEDCYQSLKALQGKLREAIQGNGDPKSLPGLIETRKVELARLQELDLALEKLMLDMPTEQVTALKTALVEFGQRFELLAASEQDILHSLESMPQESGSIQNGVKNAESAGGKLDVSQ